MPGYVQIPQCSVSATLEDIIKTGLLLYDTGGYRRYIAMPEIGVPFGNNEYLNQHCFKVNYFQLSNGDYYCVIGTLPNSNTTLVPRCYVADSTDKQKTIFGSFNNTDPLTVTVTVLPMSVKELPSWASVFSTLEECKEAMSDGNWDYVPVDNDPYGGGGASGPGGGTGSFDGTGDNISIPGLPTLSAVDTGFITLFNPTLGQMRNLASYMWSDLFDVNTWKKIFADPMDAILGLSIVPVAVPNGAEKEVKVGNISTGVSMTVATSQYVVVDCGTLNVNEYWGSYLDYAPYTQAEIYLPYIGTHPISIDDIMNKPVHVVYHVDILSGACCAHVQCGGTVLYSFIGQCASSIPITGDNWTNVINGAISIAGSIGSMVATGGATAPMAIGQIASTAVNAMKPTVEKSGAMGGTGGMLGVQTPYLILTRPRQALPRYQNTFMGYPSFITEKLQDLTGYTEIDSIHLENVPATESELSEIEDLLKGGVIF